MLAWEASALPLGDTRVDADYSSAYMRVNAGFFSVQLPMIQDAILANAFTFQATALLSAAAHQGGRASQYTAAASR
jgi:hypothetical protein